MEACQQLQLPLPRSTHRQTCTHACSHTDYAGTHTNTLTHFVNGRRQYIQTKTGQDVPKENIDTGLEELVAAYKSELGLSDKEAAQLEHLQVSHASYQACRQPLGQGSSP